MPNPPLWERLRSARIVQVGAVYLGASWVVLQIVETLQGLLSLPAWVGPVAVLLLFVGLVVVSATAWVQSLPQTTAAEEAGDVPTDWEVAPADAIASLRRGRIPHLTWGRAILGGVFALSLLFGFAGVAVLVRGGGALVGPRQAGAEGAAAGIAVLPFHMSGEGMDVYREGMVDLMSANLDGLSAYRAIDARTVLARWNREIGETADVELDQALRVAAATGARYAVVGSGVLAGPTMRLNADVYDLADGRAVGGDARVEGAPDAVLSLVDQLTVDVMRSLLDATGASSTAQTFRLASLLTESVPALRDYLEGDAHFRRTRFEEAREALHRAVEEDSTFALAYWRLGETYGWIEGIGNEDATRYKDRAAALAHRLPEREATLLEVSQAIGSFSLDAGGMSTLRAYLRRYPDDPDGWYLLGEAGLHNWSGTGITDRELEEALYRTVELDPTFGPYYEHALHWATAKGHEERYHALLAAAEAAGDAPERRERMRLRWALFQGDDGERATAATRLEDMTFRDAQMTSQAAIGLLDANLERLEPLWVRDPNLPFTMMGLYDQQGRLAEMVRLAEESDDPDLIAEVAGRVTGWAQVGSVPPEILRRLDELVGPRDPEQGFPYFARADLDLALGRPVDQEALATAVRQDLDEWLRTVPATFDTAAIRTIAMETLELDVLVREGRAREAFDNLASVLETTPGAPHWFRDQRYGWLAVEAGALGEALEPLEGMSRSRDRTLVKFNLGRAYEGLGRTEEALDAYRTFLSRTAPADEQLGAVIYAREAVARLEGRAGR